MTINGMFRALIPGINIFSPLPPPRASKTVAHVGRTNACMAPRVSSYYFSIERINLSIERVRLNAAKARDRDRFELENIPSRVFLLFYNCMIAYKTCEPCSLLSMYTVFYE